MFRLIAGLPAVLLALVFAAACSQSSPTSPTTFPVGVTAGAASSDTPSVPAAVIPVPANALGATRFLAFGDSITAGVESGFDGMFLFDVPELAFPVTLQSMLNAQNLPGGFSVANHGVPGERASQGVARLTGLLAPPTPQVLLLLSGINDMIGGVSPEETAASVLRLVDIGRLFNCTVLVATMPQTYYTVEPGSGRIRENAHTQIIPFNDELRRLIAGRQNVHLVDLYAAFGSDRSLMGGDGLHPTAAGYARMAQTFHARISQVFVVRGSLQ